MKPFAIILVVLVIAALAGLGWMFFSSRLDVSFESCATTDPLTQADVFSQLKESLENDTFIGTRYSTDPLSAPENYIFYTWTVDLRNNSFLPADVIEMQITPMSGDVLLIGDTAEHTLSPRTRGKLSATVLTARNSHSVREAIVTWYIWGLPFSTRLTLGK